jgi:hypothetical protein
MSSALGQAHLQVGAALAIHPSPDYIQHLQSLVHSPEQLQSSGYVVTQLTPAKIKTKKRCFDCSKRESQLLGNGPRWNVLTLIPIVIRKPSSNNPRSRHGRTQSSHQDAGQMPGNSDSMPQEIIIRCRFHNGHVSQQVPAEDLHLHNIRSVVR